MIDRTLRPGTLAVHAGEEPDPTTGALEPPIVLASAYAFPSADDAAAQFRGEQEGWIYGRWRNPTVESFERKIAALEGAEASVALASGMAAVHGALASIVQAGDRIVAISRTGTCVTADVTAVGTAAGGVTELTTSPIAVDLPASTVVVNLGRAGESARRATAGLRAGTSDGQTRQ